MLKVIWYFADNSLSMLETEFQVSVTSARNLEMWWYTFWVPLHFLSWVTYLYWVLFCCAFNHVQKRPLNLAKLLSERYRLRNRFCESLKLAQLKPLNGLDPGINAVVLIVNISVADVEFFKGSFQNSQQESCRTTLTSGQCPLPFREVCWLGNAVCTVLQGWL